MCSASWEAREFGLRAGMPISRAVRLCPGAMFVPVPGRECQLAHRAIRQVLEQWTPAVQPASIDEFYLDLTGTERLYRDEPLAVTAARVRASVLEATGFTLSIGGGTNRMVAKMAAERAKPRHGSGASGVLVVPPGQEAAFMADRDLAEIPGVGPKLQVELRKRALVRVSDALRIEETTLAQWLGRGTAGWLYHCMRGHGSTEIQVEPANKSISRETTFSRDLASDEAVESRLLRLLTELAAELRRDRLATRCVTVKLRDHDFRTRQAGRTLPEALSTDRALFEVARDLLRSLRQRRRAPARLVGVNFSALQSIDGADQLDLMSGAGAGETPRDRRLADAVDRISQKIGRKAIGPARLAGAPPSRIHFSFPPPKDR